MSLNFSQILKDLRQEKGLTQAELSGLLGYTQSNICEWEKGSVEPKANALIVLAEFFNVTVDYLLGLDGGFAGKSVENLESGVTFDEREIISGYRALNNEGKFLVKATIKTLLDSARSGKVKKA